MKAPARFFNDLFSTVFIGTFVGVIIYFRALYRIARWLLFAPLVLLLGFLMVATPLLAVITMLLAMGAQRHYDWFWPMLGFLGYGWSACIILMMVYLAVDFLEQRAREAVCDRVGRLFQPRQEILPPLPANAEIGHSSGLPRP